MSRDPADNPLRRRADQPVGKNPLEFPDWKTVTGTSEEAVEDGSTTFSASSFDHQGQVMRISRDEEGRTVVTYRDLTPEEKAEIAKFSVPDRRDPLTLRAFLVQGTLYLLTAFGVGAIIRATLYALGG